MKTLYVYVGGWAFVLGMCLRGIAGAAAGGASTMAHAKVETVFEQIGRWPWGFATAILLLWLAYSIPFVVAVALARSELSGLYRKVTKGPASPP